MLKKILLFTIVLAWGGYLTATEFYQASSSRNDTYLGAGVSAPFYLNGLLHNEYKQKWHDFHFTINNTGRYKISTYYEHLSGDYPHNIQTLLLGDPVGYDSGVYEIKKFSGMSSAEVYMETGKGYRIRIQIASGDYMSEGSIANGTYTYQVKLSPVLSSCMVTFNANGGAVSETTRSVKSGYSIGSLPTPTRSGYTFDGWYTSASGGTKVTSSRIITGNAVFYAHWTKNFVLTLSSTSHYEYEGGGGAGWFDITCNSAWSASTTDDWITLSSRSGSGSGTLYYEYEGNNSQSVRIGYITVTSGSLSRTFKIWQAGFISTVTVVWHANGGTLIDEDDTIVDNLTNTSLLNYMYMPIRSYPYRFAGWYTAPVGGRKVVKGTPVSDYIGAGASSVTLYAHWIHRDLAGIPEDEFEIFDCSGTAPDLGRLQDPFVAAAFAEGSAQGSTGFRFTSAISTTRHIFVRIDEDVDDFNARVYMELWDMTSEQYVTSFSRMSGVPCRLTAGHEYRFTVYRQSGSGTQPRREELPYIVQVGGEEASFDFMAAPEILALNSRFLIWTEIPEATKYKVYRYFAPPPGKTGGGYLEFVAETSSSYYRHGVSGEDCAFCVRAVNSSVESVLSSTKTKDAFDELIYAVEFDANGGVGSSDVRFVEAGVKIGELPTPVRVNCVFVGWYTARSGGAKVSAQTIVTKDIVLYAQWKTHFTVVLHKNDGTGATVGISVKYGTPTALPGAVADLSWAPRRGFSFMGWSTSEKSKTLWKKDKAVLSTTVSAGETFHAYAIWQLKTASSYAIQYIRNDGSGSVRTIGFNGGVATKLNSVKALGFERRGYTFVGWATSTADARNKKVWKKDMGVVSQPVANGKLLQIYAIWKLTPGYYSIRFNKNDGSGKWRELGYKYGENTTLPTIVNGLKWSRAGYTFGGWATSAANAANGIAWRGDKGVTRTPVAAGKTLNVYAIWKKTSAAARMVMDVNAFTQESMSHASLLSFGAAEPARLLPGYYSGELADGTGMYDLLVDEGGETGYVNIVFDDGSVLTEEVEVDILGDIILVVNKNGELCQLRYNKVCDDVMVQDYFLEVDD